MKTSSVLITVGVGIVVIGVILRYFPSAFTWFGNLPGDIRRESGNTRVFIPITSMLLMSVVATLVINVISRLFRGE